MQFRTFLTVQACKNIRCKLKYKFTCTKYDARLHDLFALAAYFELL